ncbi:MAG TPA: adenylate/guanylate cyclase domain-containing protein [Beijerinckia sp.]|nr:adenylate/guanylate cyclase domain-containing protein [Beijerinckia sp.]
MRESIEPSLSRHEGRLIKTTGDGALAEFASPLAAVRCAVEIQDHLASSSSPLRLRVGLNLGDVIIGQDGDLYGDGINIAVRLEGIADPGGILISEKVYGEIEGKLDVGFEDRGEQQLKNISRPVRAYAVRPGAHSSLTERLSAAPRLPDKPSIAVLPFQNMSGDPEQEYFADGMVEEIITALSRFKGLFVIARNSSFAFKGKAVNVKEVGSKLGVRYVLEGSVRKAAGKVRITGQLIDAVTDAHIWADRFERDLTDVFSLQDELTVAVVGAIQPKLLQTEIEMATRRPPENPTAYDLVLRAIQKLSLRSREGFAEAIQLAHRAMDLNPRLLGAAQLAASGHLNNVILGFSTDPQFDRSEAIRLARLALSLDQNDERALGTAGLVTAFLIGDCETAIDFVDRAAASNPNFSGAWNYRGWVYQVAGRYEEAILSFERAIRVSPLDPWLHNNLAGIGYALIELRRFDEAVAVSKKALRQNSSDGIAFRGLASALAHLGRDAEAREALARLREINPAYAVGAPSQIAQSHKLLIEGLLKAGTR